MRLQHSGTSSHGARLLHSIKSLFPGLIPLIILAFFMAITMIINVIPRPPSEAAPSKTVDLGEIKYNVGELTVEGVNDPTYDCQVLLPITITAKDQTTATKYYEVLTGAPTTDLNDDQESTGLVSLTEERVEGNTLPFNGRFSVDCEAIGGLAAYPGGQVGALDHNKQDPQQPRPGTLMVAPAAYTAPMAAAAALPRWTKWAFGIFAGAVTFFAVAAVLTVALAYFAPAIVAALGEVAADMAMTAVTGCLANAIGQAVGRHIAGKSNTLGSAIKNCLEGAAIANLSKVIRAARNAMAAALRPLEANPAPFGGPDMEPLIQQAGDAQVNITEAIQRHIAEGRRLVAPAA
jgi:hypothetical protein